MNVYLYIRLSSADDDLKFKTESESIANQRALLHQYLKTHQEFSGCVVTEFVDDGYTGTNDARPSFERMIGHLKNGDANVVLCKDFSRFFRDYVEIGDYLERIFPFLGVRFIAVNDGYDSSDYKGTTAGMDVVMKYIVYSYYSRDLSKKIKTVFESRVKRGDYLGSFAPYGYKKDPQNKNHLIPDPITAPVVRQIFDLALEGKTISEIAKELNRAEIDTPSTYFHKVFPDCKRFRNKSKQSSWDSNNVRTILKRKEYTGAVISGKRTWKGIENPITRQKDESEWIIVPGCHDAIVSTNEFEEAQKIMRKLRKYQREPKNYLLRSLLRCGVCERVLSRNPRAKKTYYHCDKSRHNPDTECPVGEKFYETDLERVITANLMQMLTLLVDCDKSMKEAAAKTKGSESNLRQSILKIEKSIKQQSLTKVDAYERYSDGELSKQEFLIIRDEVAVEVEKLNGEKLVLEDQLNTLLHAEEPELGSMAASASHFLKEKEMTNQMLLFFIDRVYVYSGMKLDIRYKFSDGLMKTLQAYQAEVQMK